MEERERSHRTTKGQRMSACLQREREKERERERERGRTTQIQNEPTLNELSCRLARSRNKPK